MSKPAPSAGAQIKSCAMGESSAFLFRCALLFFRVRRYGIAIINSATTRVSIADASAAKTADEKLIRTAMFPNGTSEAR